MARQRRVLAMGWFGEGNLGDEAMLAGLLALVDRAAGPVDVTVATGDPAGTASRFGTRVIRRASPQESGFRNVRFVRTVMGSDLVTLGGGDLLREQRDGTVPARNWLARMRVPLAVRRRTAMLGISVGELVTPSVIAEVGRSVRRMTLVAARDVESAERLRRISGRTVHVMGDLALETIALPNPAGRVRRLPGDGPPRIGVAVRSIHGRGPSVPEDAGDRLFAHLAAALDAVAIDRGAAIELIPLRVPRTGRGRDDDSRAGEALAAMAESGTAWIRRTPPEDATAFAAIAAGLDLMISIRLHGAVLGAAAGVPVLGVAYDPKVSGFLVDLGLADQVLPLEATSDEIVDAVRRSLDDPELESRIRAGVDAMRRRTAAIEPLLREIIAG